MCACITYIYVVTYLVCIADWFLSFSLSLSLSPSVPLPLPPPVCVHAMVNMYVLRVCVLETEEEDRQAAMNDSPRAK